MDEIDVRMTDQGTEPDQQLGRGPSVVEERQDIKTETGGQENSSGSQDGSLSRTEDDNGRDEVLVSKEVTVLVVTDVDSGDRVQNSGLEADSRHEQEEEAKHVLASETREEVQSSQQEADRRRDEQKAVAEKKQIEAAGVTEDPQSAPQRPHDESGRSDESGTSVVMDSLERAFEAIRGVAQCVSRSLERVTQEDFRENARQNIHMLARGNVTPLEQCVSSLLGECSGLSEQVFPCAATTPEAEDSGTPKPPPIVMVVDTPAGPYIRVVPNCLVDEAVKQGLVQEEDVQLQREFPFYQSKQSLQLA
ncbi:conserved hypothetical protein [Neospora caninum Liverpool]|uniref:Uncharacterized protein n=1 Tax=Neospora caninum (strain Liverpool) TaxID=572307 RepID=F0VPR0_NEOCL|nr:conserved hypothetical protein [Neospora caninum Liverpool]CBZ55707.1 conserved hypothetical protein [Neospora caninum Liverpool]CEL70450.1 TPA: hypothetical protein BN1204_061320 [Neospora caninum Liverpool]|eukprot:XP_003885733.1 conserved hypothetical protein [Neospora caninum Liverpool]